MADEGKKIKAMSNPTWQKEGYGINMANIATLRDSSRQAPMLKYI
jgi:hypothetical protein